MFFETDLPRACARGYILAPFRGLIHRLKRQLIRRSNPNAPLATKSSAPTNARVGRELAVFGSEAGLGSGVGGGPADAGAIGGGAGTSTNSTPTSGTGLGAGAGAAAAA